MKKLVLVLGLAFVGLSTSCEKEDIKTTDQKSGCNCGLVISDDASDYSVVIRNSCSQNSKKFILAPGDWLNAHVGSNYCITNSTGW